MTYRTFLVTAAARVKRQGVADLALRYNPITRLRVSRTIEAFRRADLAGRRALSERLTARTIAAARRCNYGREFGNRYEDWPLLRNNVLRDSPSTLARGKVLAIPAATGGTTGTPIRLERSVASVAAEQTFLDRLLGPDGPRWGTARIAILRGDNVKDAADTAPPFGVETNFGRRLLLSGLHLTKENSSWYFDALRRFRPQILLAYPNQAINLLRLLEQAGQRIRFDAIVTSSERLAPELRTALERDLGVCVHDFYGQAERVCFAASSIAETYYFDPAYGRVELLPAEWYDAREGRRAASIIGTTFWNDAMPLVRYDTGDLAIVPAAAGPAELEQIALGLRPFLGIAGRTDEFVLTPDGLRICALNQIVREVDNLLQVQIIQETSGFVLVRALTRPGFGTGDHARLLSNIRAKMPTSLACRLELVDRLYTTPAGKTPFVIRHSP
jgi:phenylacetate-coenzyme A ligase PaaK-like adenylate-forming protein